MNRIHLSSLGSQTTHEASPHDASPHDTSARVEQSLLRTDQRHGLPHALFAPLHYEANYAYPLLVWLHGPGDDERQLQRVMPLISMRNYVAVGPRGSCQTPGQPGCDWVGHDSVAYDPAGQDAAGHAWDPQAETAVRSAEQRVFDCIEAASERFHIHPQRIFLAGFESGGTMAFRVGLKHPECFAGVLSVGGAFPSGGRPLVRLDQARRLPLFIAQGRDSQKYPIDRTCEELRLFHAAGLSVTLRQYPCGDDLHTQMLHDMDVWLMEQVTGIRSSSDDTEPEWPGESN